MSYIRLDRRNRTAQDMGLLGRGGLNDAFDDAIKHTFRINDKEYDYICENATDDQLGLMTKENLTFSEKKTLALTLQVLLSGFFLQEKLNRLEEALKNKK